MNSELLRLCEAFIRNRDAVKRVFRSQYTAVYPACANVYLSHAREADEDVLRDCRRIVRENAGVFSGFRSTMYAPVSCMLACSACAEERLAQAADYYKQLKKSFHAGNQTALAAMLLCDLTKPTEAAAIIGRARTLCSRMKSEHPLLAGPEDTVFSLMLAFSEKDDDALLREVEDCYARLKGAASGSFRQTAAQILALGDESAEAKCEKLLQMLSDLRTAKVHCGKYYSLAILAALVITGISPAAAVAEICDADAFLAAQKGYRGVFGIARQQRAMHAAMIVTTCHTPSPQSSAAALSSMISLVAAQSAAIAAVCAASAGSAASSAAH